MGRICNQNLIGLDIDFKSRVDEHIAYMYRMAVQLVIITKRVGGHLKVESHAWGIPFTELYILSCKL